MDDGRWQCQAAHCEHPSLFTMYTLYLVGQRGCFVLEDACFVLKDAYTQRECLFSKTGCGTVCNQYRRYFMTCDLKTFVHAAKARASAHTDRQTHSHTDTNTPAGKALLVPVHAPTLYPVLCVCVCVCACVCVFACVCVCVCV